MIWTKVDLSHLRKSRFMGYGDALLRAIEQAAEDDWDPDYIDTEQHWSLLVYAVVAEEEPLVRALLDDGANPNLRVLDDFTALDYAAMKGTSDGILRLLVAAGADIHTRWRRTREAPLLHLSDDTPLDQLNTWKELGADFSPDRLGRTLLHRWVEKGNDMQRLRRLLETGVPVDSRETYYGYTPFGWAILRNPHPEILNFLVSQGADVNGKTPQGTPYWFALAADCPGKDGGSQKQRRKKLSALLDLGVDIDSVDAMGRTFMMLTCQGSTASRTAKLVLQNHPSLQKRDHHGKTALDYLETNREMPEPVHRELRDLIVGGLHA